MLKKWMLIFFSKLVRLGLSLRYKVQIDGLDSLTPEKLNRGGSILFLPNHPAEIDPILLSAILWKNYQPRPLVVAHFFYLKWGKSVLELVGALPIPNMELVSNRWKLKQMEKAYAQVVAGLNGGDNFLIYPAGKLKQTGLEKVGGASMVHNLLQDCPKTNVVLIRTTGLWGSSFSRALTGSSPDFGATLLNGLKILLKNGIFFTPRRKVTIHFEPAPADFPYGAQRLTLNQYFEAWFNQYPQKGPEPLTLISYSFWKQEFPKVPAAEELQKELQQNIPPAIEKEVLEKLSKMSKRPADQIQRTMHLSSDLGLDSLDTAQIYVFLDERFETGSLEPGTLQTVDHVLHAAAGLRKEGKRQKQEPKAIFHWPAEPHRPSIGIPEAETLQEAFLLSCDKMGKNAACFDQISGMLTYKTCKIAALMLSKKIAKAVPEDAVGILLPSSVGVYLLIFACLLAKKTPVMLNWTVGTRALDQCKELSGINTVITSRRFLDKLDNGDLGKCEDNMLFFEDLRNSLSLFDKLQALFLSRKSASSLISSLGLNSVSKNDPAVILFTSGTESLPKGVPLSHFNLLSNQRAALSIAELQNQDVMYGVLPPFHSFGFSVTGILPILAGLKVCYAPDPTDSYGMAHDVALYHITLFVCAPSFIKTLFRVSDPKHLSTLRLVVSGAEKAPPELFDYMKKLGPNAQFIEGYGITECGPIVSINRPGAPPRGVGPSLPGVELCVIDPETHAPMPQGKDGEICIRGPNVFANYLGHPRDPFVILDGAPWYRSGDRGRLDPHGCLHISGRYKRFAKIGGEMVSLGGLEEELTGLAVQRKWVENLEKGPVLAIAARETETDKPTIILFTTFEVTRDEVNTSLKEGGYGRIVKIGEIKKLPEIPLTGTGKTNYRLLDDYAKTV